MPYLAGTRHLSESPNEAIRNSVIDPHIDCPVSDTFPRNHSLCYQTKTMSIPKTEPSLRDA